MILFEYIKYKNILSTGNNWAKIDLNKDKSTLIVGDNGAGKSTFLDALCFALYGKPFRKINKPQLVNSINQKNLEVEVAFTTNNKRYVIKRGIKPNLFEIWQDDTLINQEASARDYQAYLEDNVLKMNMKSFAQIVVLGSSTFVPFMQLNANQRREVIEDLLDIQIFTTMNTLLKERVQANKEEMTELKYQTDLVKQKIDSAKTHNESIRKLRQGQIEQLVAKANTHMQTISTEKDKMLDLQQQVDDLQQTIEDKQNVTNAIGQCDLYKQKIIGKAEQYSKEIKFFQTHHECPTCSQDIDEQFKHIEIDNLADKLRTCEDNLEKLNDRREKEQKRLQAIKKVEDNIEQLKLKINDCRATVNVSQSALKSLRAEIESAKMEAESVDQSAIEELEQELQSYQINYQQLLDQREIYSVVAAMLRDGGIKTRIVKQYVPVMNKLINKYLSAMDFFVDFQLDENFNETIMSRYRDSFSYSSFSEGEKLRIDLALLFTWRAVSKLRNSVSTNLLIMDEIMDSSLDNAGTEEFLKIINELTADSNIFIISHKGDQLIDKFERVLKFSKVKNFTVLES